MCYKASIYQKILQKVWATISYSIDTPLGGKCCVFLAFQARLTFC